MPQTNATTTHVGSCFRLSPGNGNRMNLWPGGRRQERKENERKNESENKTWGIKRPWGSNLCRVSSPFLSIPFLLSVRRLTRLSYALNHDAEKKNTVLSVSSQRGSSPLFEARRASAKKTRKLVGCISRHAECHISGPRLSRALLHRSGAVRFGGDLYVRHVHWLRRAHRVLPIRSFVIDLVNHQSTKFHNHWLQSLVLDI